MATAEIEARLSRLEEKMERIERGQKKPNATSPDWLDKVFGIFADCPEFDEMVKAGQKWRKTESVI